jgi:hypothetical protein
MPFFMEGIYACLDQAVVKWYINSISPTGQKFYQRGLFYGFQRKKDADADGTISMG